jgi:signal transduction histidine kinase
MEVERYKNKIFTLYQRFHNHVEGKGMGLYLVKTQVEALNGTIEVESTVGKGSVFIISIPNTSQGGQTEQNRHTNNQL